MLSSDGKAYPDNLTLPTIFANPEYKFTQCAVGRDHMVVIYQDGRLLTMGSEDHGKLGHSIKEKS